MLPFFDQPLEAWLLQAGPLGLWCPRRLLALLRLEAWRGELRKVQRLGLERLVPVVGGRAGIPPCWLSQLVERAPAHRLPCLLGGPTAGCNGRRSIPRKTGTMLEQTPAFGEGELLWLRLRRVGKPPEPVAKMEQAIHDAA